MFCHWKYAQFPLHTAKAMEIILFFSFLFSLFLKEKSMKIILDHDMLKHPFRFLFKGYYQKMQKTLPMFETLSLDKIETFKVDCLSW